MYEIIKELHFTMKVMKVMKVIYESANERRHRPRSFADSGLPLRVLRALCGKYPMFP